MISSKIIPSPGPGRYHKTIDFKDIDITVGMDILMDLLLDNELNIFCKNLDIDDSEVLNKVSESVIRRWKEKYPDSLLSPELELYDPSGDGVYYLAKLNARNIKLEVK